MNWLGVLSYLAYGTFMAGCLYVVYRLVTGRWNADSSGQAGWVLCAVSLMGGLVMASAAAPDWSPLTMFGLWLPFFGISAWSAFYTRFVGKGMDRTKAGVRALVFAVPSLFLAPVAMVLLILL